MRLSGQLLFPSVDVVGFTVVVALVVGGCGVVGRGVVGRGVVGRGVVGFVVDVVDCLVVEGFCVVLSVGFVVD